MNEVFKIIAADKYNHSLARGAFSSALSWAYKSSSSERYFFAVGGRFSFNLARLF